MPYIKSASPDFKAITQPGTQTNYAHGADTRTGYIPLAFQVTSPFDFTKVMLPHALVMHVNPASFAEAFTKKIERIQTRGGFVEQHWGDDLGDINCDGSTGAFMNLYTGLSSIVRQRTIAWDRYRDLYDLYRNNGSLIDPYGNIVLQGKIMLMYDRGTYLGYFKSFSVEETDETPFAFKISWSFKVETTLYQVPQNNFLAAAPRTPTFQTLNQTSAPQTSLPSGGTTQGQAAEAAYNLAATQNAQLFISAGQQAATSVANGFKSLFGGGS